MYLFLGPNQYLLQPLEGNNLIKAFNKQDKNYQKWSRVSTSDQDVRM